MWHFSPVQLVFIALIVLSIFPAWRILHRLGLSPAWLLICLVPIGGFIGLWLLAFVRWPNMAPGPDGEASARAPRPPPAPL